MSHFVLCRFETKNLFILDLIMHHHHISTMFYTECIVALKMVKVLMKVCMCENALNIISPVFSAFLSWHFSLYCFQAHGGPGK